MGNTVEFNIRGLKVIELFGVIPTVGLISMVYWRRSNSVKEERSTSGLSAINSSVSFFSILNSLCKKTLLSLTTGIYMNIV